MLAGKRLSHLAHKQGSELAQAVAGLASAHSLLIALVPTRAETVYPPVRGAWLCAAEPRWSPPTRIAFCCRGGVLSLSRLARRHMHCMHCAVPALHACAQSLAQHLRPRSGPPQAFDRPTNNIGEDCFLVGENCNEGDTGDWLPCCTGADAFEGRALGSPDCRPSELDPAASVCTPRCRQAPNTVTGDCECAATTLAASWAPACPAA